jgi:elongator complex protein 3
MNKELEQKKLFKLVEILRGNLDLSWPKLLSLIKKHPKEDGGFFSKTEIIEAHRQLYPDKPYGSLVQKLRLKPTRSASGVAPVTILTKPYPCPGNCLFCPNDLRMPKSYLAEEPGAQRAEKNYFDPYLQVMSRLNALASMGHRINKVELIILGGTWTNYPKSYRLWFIQQSFRALNDFNRLDQSERIRQRYERALKKLDEPHMSSVAKENLAILEQLNLNEEEIRQNYNQLINKHYLLPEKKAGIDRWQQASFSELSRAHKKNETALARCIGLVLETRPDEINQDSVLEMRKLGATKIQLGVQTLDDKVLKLNNRGHSVAETKEAFKILRQLGFKIHVHWMANLYGSNVVKDQADFIKLFADENFRPDELKIYPCSLIASAPLMQYYKEGKWQPYSHEELLKVTTFTLKNTPAYCRITRMLRDIPAQDIVSGNIKSNFRQIAEAQVKKDNIEIKEIRSREIRRQEFDPKKIKLSKIKYQTQSSVEYFLQFTVMVEGGEEKILGFLRLSLPKKKNHWWQELSDSALIREIHVYGQALALGAEAKGRAQHLGLGTRLIEEAKTISQRSGFKKLAVISAIGTKEYYRNRGFSDGDLYQSLSISKRSRV